ncbi:hypothetical protein V6N13_147270 [Hibiscus sabdariffa]
MAVPTAVTLPASMVSLYVGDLHPDIVDETLFDAFKEFKGIASVHVCRDSSTGRSLCYGYANFSSLQDAHYAMEKMNHSLINGKMIRVAWSLRDPDARKSGVGNVFVKNLSGSMDSVGLQELFQKFGNVISCKVATFEDGKSKGYGFVQFESEESANAAIEKLDNTVIGDKQIYVGKFMKKCDRVLPSPDIRYTNLYVKNLDPDITEEILQEKFSEFGKIACLVVARDENGTSRGFGFVNFECPDDAKRATESLNGSRLGSKVLYVARAQKKAEREQMLRNQFEERRKEQIMKYKASNVYVKNIDDDVTDDELRDLFSLCGTITSAKLMRDEKGINKGFGFVCFHTPEEAAKAVGKFHGYMFHRKPLYVAIAQRKEDRQAQLQLQFAQHMAGLAGPSTAVLPGGYPPLFYTSPTGIVSQVPPRPGMMYQPLGIRPGWRGNGFAPPARPVFQPSLPSFPTAPRQTRPNRGRMNGHALIQGGSHPMTYVSQSQQLTQMAKDQSSQQIEQAKNARNGRAREVNKGSGVAPVGSNSVAAGTEMLSSMLPAASPEQQKTILGERLYPLVQKQQPELVPKITGMLLEMDNSELVVLLESPEALAAKVEEAVEVLKLSNAKVSAQDPHLHPNFLSAGVAVN